MLDVDNQTPLQFPLPGSSTPAQPQEVRRVLQAHQLPHVVAFSTALPADDPIVAYPRRDYEPVAEVGDIGQAIFLRKRELAP